MRDHYLLDLHEIHPSFAKRIVKQGRATWVIEIKAPMIGTCPDCGRRSRNPKERGVKGIHERKLILPARKFQRPDPELLERRYGKFQAAG